MHHYCNASTNAKQFKKTSTFFKQRHRSNTREKVRLATKSHRLPKDFFHPQVRTEECIGGGTQCFRTYTNNEDGQDEGMKTPAFRTQSLTKQVKNTPFFPNKMQVSYSQNETRQENPRIATLPVAPPPRLYLSREENHRTLIFQKDKDNMHGPHSHRHFFQFHQQQKSEDLGDHSLHKKEKVPLSSSSERQQIKFKNKLTIDTLTREPTEAKKSLEERNKIRRNINRFFAGNSGNGQINQSVVRRISSKPNKLPPLL